VVGSVVLSLFVACTNTSESDPTTGGPTSAPLASLLPAAARAKGSITIATDAAYPPNEFFDADGKTIIGMDVDLAKALGEVLGLKVHVVNASFESILPGVAAGKYDVGMSSFTDTREREKIVDFVTYFLTGTSFYTRTEGGTDVTGLDDLCGRTVAVLTGTIHVDDAAAQNRRCMIGGRPGVGVQQYPNQNSAVQAVLSGRAHLSMTDSPAVAYQIKLSRGKLKIVGQPYGTAPYGIAVRKNSGLAQTLLAALKELNANGIYIQILDTWGVAAGAMTNFTINGAVN
jgi:polar amino acid transport system substrate-binding protein